MISRHNAFVPLISYEPAHNWLICLLRRRNQERYDDHTCYQANAENSREGRPDFYPSIKRVKGEQW